MTRSANSPRTQQFIELVLLGLLIGALGVAATPLVGELIAAEISTGHRLHLVDPVGNYAGFWTGHATTGLAPASRPSAAAIYACSAGAFLLVALLLAGMGWLALAGVGGLRPGYARGREIRKVAGLGRLRSRRKELRPELKGPFEPSQYGIRIGEAGSHELYTAADRTIGVIGPQGCGKSLDLLLPAAMACPGPVLMTLTKVADLSLVIDERARRGPVVVLDPYQLAPGLPEFVWDTVEGCEDARVATRRASAFVAVTLDSGSDTGMGQSDGAAAFYKGESTKALAAMMHAAALTGRSMEHVAGWIGRPDTAAEAVQILREHPEAELHFDHRLAASVFNPDVRTSGNTKVTIQQAMEPFAVAGFRDRVVPAPGRPATDIADLLRRNGTIILLGREDPYSPVTPLMTAAAEHILDVARQLSVESPAHRLSPWMLAALDELPSVAPIPSLVMSMANDRALGISYLWASQTRHQLIDAFGQHGANALLGLSNNLIVFGGGKDERFYSDMAALIGDTRLPGSFRREFEYMPVIRPGDLRRLKPGRALLLTETARPIRVRLQRCLTGPDGARLLRQARQVDARVAEARSKLTTPAQRRERAHAAARARHLLPPEAS